MQKALCILLFFGTYANAQSVKLLSSLDSSYVAGNKIIEQNDVLSFFASGMGDVEIEIQKIDQQLLNAALHFSINRLRLARNKSDLQYNKHLDFLAYNCVNFYPASKFKVVNAGREKHERVLYMAARNSGLHQNLISCNLAYVDILNVQLKKKIYLSSDENYPGFYYQLGEKRQPASDEKVPNRTYNELAQEIVNQFSKGQNRQFLLSNSFEISACYVQLDPISLGRSTPAKFKVIQVIAGKRLAVVVDEKED